MMGAGTKNKRIAGQLCLTTFILLSSIFWSCYLYKPLPEGISNPWKVRCIVALFKVVEDLAKLGERMGVANKITSIRAITNGLAMIMKTDSPGLKVYDTVFDGVKVRVYDPISKQERGPAVVFYHGGGWFFCNVDVHDHMTRTLAQRLNVVLVSVEYRLAPEHPYRAPLEDCVKATRHFLNNAKDWSVDPHRVAVMGDSAGGNLAASVTLDLHRASNFYQPKLQVLIYPVLQGFDLTLPSFIENDDIVYGSRSSMAEVMLYYMGEDIALASHVASNNHLSAELRREHMRLVNSENLPERFRSGNLTAVDPPKNLLMEDPLVVDRLKHFILDPLFAPLMAESVEGLASAYIVTAQFDVLRDDGVMYAERLKRSGVKVTWAHYEDAFHGFWAFFNPPIQLDSAQHSMNDLVSYLEQNL